MLDRILLELQELRKEIAELRAELPKKRKPREEKPTTDLPEFDRFWHYYPRKCSKPPAVKAWKSVQGWRHVDLIIRDIESRLASGSWNDVQYIPYPSTYLNQRRWEDSSVTDHEVNMI